jgi:hypothetical protein
MTLLLAFFIIMQAFASEQEEGLFYAGRGSFIRALKTFGLGGILDRAGGGLIQDARAPRYRTDEGGEEPPRLRRIDPEMESAQQALAALEEQYDTAEPDKGVGYRVELSAPRSRHGRSGDLTEEERRFFRELGPRVERVLLARGFVVRITTVPAGSGARPEQRLRASLEAAEQVRTEMMQTMGAAGRALARRRIYSFVQCGARRPGEEGQIKVDILLTKPYLRELREEGESSDEGMATG